MRILACTALSALLGNRVATRVTHSPKFAASVTND
jgi:hypothetical protein